MGKFSLHLMVVTLVLFLMHFDPLFVHLNKGIKDCFEEKRILQDTIIRSNERLSLRDSLLLDSILRVSRYAAKEKYIRFMAEGKLPVGVVNINYNNLFAYNLYEGIKLGFGAETNRLLSKYASLGGYVTYGLKENSLRHGTWLNIYPDGYYNFRIYLGFRDVNVEYGESEFLEKRSLLIPESYRSLLVENMYSSQRYTAGVELRPINELNTYIYTDLSVNGSSSDNYFLSQHLFPRTHLTRIGLQLRYSPGLEFIKDPDFLIEKNIPKSDWFLTAIQGLNILGGDYQYTKVEFKGRFKFLLAPGSSTRIILRSGVSSHHTPLIELFNGYGSYVNTFSFIAPFSFNTMRQNEFAASRYAAIHLRHEFGSTFYPPLQKFRPVFVFSQNIGLGYLNSDSSQKYQMTDFRKGFFESGFEINNLLKLDILSGGLGIYYRYGPYQLPVFSDNIAYKFGLYITL